MRRLFAALVLFLGVMSSAWADYDAVPYEYSYNGRQYLADPQGACLCSGGGSTCTAAAAGLANMQIDGATPPNCVWTYKSGATQSFAPAMHYNCPYGGTLTNTTVNGKIVPRCIGADPPVNCPKTQNVEDWFPYEGDPNGKGFPVCSDLGCSMTVSYVGSCVKLGSTGVTWCDMKGDLSGSKCSSVTDNTQLTDYGSGQSTKPSGTSSGTNMPTTPSGSQIMPCPTGTVQGGIDKDGVPLCIGSGANPQQTQTPTTTTKPTTTVTNADGSSTATSITVQQNSDGSTTTTTTTTTTATDGTKTVSVNAVTSNNSSGTAGKADTPNADANNLCKQNPNLSICRNSSVSGSCATLVCTGDAVQCATLQAAQKLECAREADQTALQALPGTATGTAILNGADPQQGAMNTLIKGDTVDMSKSSLDQSGFIGGGACLPDKTFTVRGKSVTVSFTTICNNIQPLRFVVLACAFLVAYLLVARSVLNG